MIGRKAASGLGKAIFLAVSALVLSTGMLSRAAAQEARIDRVGVSAPVGGIAAAMPVGAPLSGIDGGFLAMPSAFASPSIHLSAPAVPALALSAVAAAPSALAPQTDGASAASPAVRPAASPSALPASGLISAPLAAADENRSRSAETERSGAERDFSALIGESLAEGKGGAPLSVAATEVSVSGARLSPAARTGASFLAVVPAALLAFHPSFHAAAQQSPAVWHMISQAGNVVGNLGCAIFPLVQIYETFHGKSTPKSRAILGAVASLGLGLISAPIMHDALWGFQNIFGGMTLLVPLLIGGLAARARGNGLKQTALIAAGAAAVSIGVYFALAAALPGLLAAVLSAAAIGKLTLGVQIATSAMFVLMYLPEAIRGLRGKSTKGFSQGFTLVYFISSAASMVWALPAAWILHDPHQLSYRLIFGVNTIYATTSFISYWVARRRAKAG
ncbi:MAG: hypothetical protein ACHQ2Z_15970 [Elusimicrobiota bacterium]